MELWIRSQDKVGLVKINSDIGLKYNDNKTIIANYIPDFTDNYDGSYNLLGTYETKERALEVLGEIQNRMIKGAFAKKINGLGEELDLIPNNLLIYEMPLE